LPAALYLRGAVWAQAAQAVERIASWRRIPQPLEWMVQARWRTQGSERQGRHHEIVEQRRRLRESCAPPFARYMKTR
jgi:hypothetical protein